MDIGGDGEVVSWYVAPGADTLITVIPGEKKWSKSPLPPEQRDKMPEEYEDPAEYINRFLAHRYKELGRSVIDGVEVEGIEVTDPPTDGEKLQNGVGRLWVDVQNPIARPHRDRGHRRRPGGPMAHGIQMVRGGGPARSSSPTSPATTHRWPSKPYQQIQGEPGQHAASYSLWWRAASCPAASRACPELVEGMPATSQGASARCHATGGIARPASAL